MQALVSRASDVLRPLGYKRVRSRFVKVSSEFYRLIDFQSGAYGGGYFFVNVCIHPMGLPSLIAGRLVIMDNPLEYQCLLRRRIEEIGGESVKALFQHGLVSHGDDEAVSEVLLALSNAVEPWLARWCSYTSILDAGESELMDMLTVVPMLRHRACAMLKFFCAVRLDDRETARRYLEAYLQAPSGGYDFSAVDNYLRSLLK